MKKPAFKRDAVSNPFCRLPPARCMWVENEYFRKGVGDRNSVAVAVDAGQGGRNVVCGMRDEHLDMRQSQHQGGGRSVAPGPSAVNIPKVLSADDGETSLTRSVQ